MEKYIFLNSVLILTIIHMIIRTRHAVQILQLESYKNDRYLKWMKKNKIFISKELFLIIPIIISIFFYKIGLIVNCIVLLACTLFKKKVNEKKALVFTSRVKRIYFTEIFLAILILVLSNIFSNYMYIYVIETIMCMFIYYFVILINIINYPIEKIIQNKYYKNAKKKLKENIDLKVIGITGSFGKTSTKYILGTILSQKYNTLITPESYNTTMGVVRTINEKLNNTHQLFICEMGAKNIGDIKEICDLVKPDYGVLTAIGPQHLETFKTLENVKKTKMELVDSLSQDGIAFVNNEDENIRNIKFEKNVIKYGLSQDCDYYADEINITEFGSEFKIHTKDNKFILAKTKILGNHNIINIVGAVAVAYELGLNENEITAGIRFLKPVEHRLQLRKNPNGSIIIDDAYNSNVKGAKAALEVLRNFKGMKKVLITPGIVDLGDKQFEYNKNFGMQAAECADFIILVGEKQAKPIYEGIIENGFEKESIFIANDLNEAIKKMNEVMDNKTVVLLENDLPDNYL